MRTTSLAPTCAAFTRREILRWTALGAAGSAWLTAFGLDRATAADDVLRPLNRFPRMMQEFFVDRMLRAEQANLKAFHALKTKHDAQAYVNGVREKIAQSFGPQPEKTPLKARVTGIVKRDAYQIEKVIFESRPGFLVTANLYVPRGRDFPLPGVVGTCGHSTNGKASEAYQSFAQGLARQGYVVLIYDPIGQGERLQYPDENLKPTMGVGVAEHLHGGNQQFLVGEFFGAWRAWDGIRALDYLLAREEVDPKHVGVTGNSGGGTMTTWLCGVERRWTMAAPSCFVTSFRRNLENELPADTEQCPPRVLALGLDHSDFLAAMAPKPVIILAKERDYFDARGGEEAYRRLKRLYTLLGAEKNIQMFIGPSYHGYSQENREAMYRMFNRVTGVSDAQREPELKIEADETLYCTPRGQVAGLKSRPLYSYTKAKSQELAKRRGQPRSEQLKQAVSRTLRLPKRTAKPDYRILRALTSRKFPRNYCTPYAVNTEPGIQALVYRISDERWYSRPPQNERRAVLYVSHLSSDAELRDEPLIRELLEAEPGVDFYACDVRGGGESQPDTCGLNSFHSPYGSDYFYAIHSIMFDQPYVGQKTHDVLCVLDWLASVGANEVHLAGKGRGAAPATFAALLSEQVSQVTLKNALTSYADIAETKDYHWPLSTLPPGVLASFDLPDCYAALKGKRLRQIDPWDAQAGEKT